MFHMVSLTSYHPTCIKTLSSPLHTLKGKWLSKPHMVYFVWCILYRVFCMVYFIWYTLYNVFYMVHFVLSILDGIFCINYFVWYIVYGILYMIYCMWCIIHGVLYMTYCIRHYIYIGHLSMYVDITLATMMLSKIYSQMHDTKWKDKVHQTTYITLNNRLC